jgi:hypothetical protein
VSRNRTVQGMGGYHKGRGKSEITESLIEYTTFASLPKK